MKRLLWTAVFAALGWLTTASAADREPMLRPTSPPIVYQFGYTDRYFTDSEYIERFKAAPPDLLLVGKAVPITHLWGPVGLYAGENQYTGGPKNTLNLKNIALLTPEAMRQRVEHIRETVARYHAAGIREILPYICFMTVAGDHEKRLGFWNFYDHWSQYEKWAGPRPAQDPYEWLTVDRQGKFLAHAYYGYTPSYFAPLHRYRGCINNPGWSEWQCRLVRLIAEVGYDGCYVDNSVSTPCYCRYCKEQFRNWLAANRSEDSIRRLTGLLAAERLTLESDQTLAELVRRWRILRNADHLGTLRKAGREVKPGFTIYPNSGPAVESLAMGSQCDRLMIETPSAPGLRVADLPSGTDQSAEQPCIDHTAELLFTQHMHARTMRLPDYRILEHSKSYKQDPEFLNEMALYYLDYKLEKRWDNVQELSLAEMAAFSGGGGVAAGGQPYLVYRAFFKKHPDLFAGWRPTAPAAVLYAYWGFSKPRDAQQPIQAQLATDHRPYVALVDASLPVQAKELANFAVMYLVSRSYEMSPDQLQTLRDYAGRGRIVLASNDATINGQPAVDLLGSDRVTVWNPKKPTTPTAPIASSEGIRKNVRFALYEAGERLAVHAVNYNVCLQSPQYKVLEVDATPLAIPVPAGWKAARATCYDPGAVPETLSCIVTEGIARFTLPKLHIYKVVRLDRH